MPIILYFIIILLILIIFPLVLNHYLTGDHQTTADRDLSELTATMQDVETTPKLSHTLPQHIRRRGRRSNTGSPTHTSHRYEGPNNFDAEEERDGDHEVLTFHGLILRSQLTVMFKNKVFFNESEGVSLMNG